MRLTARLGFSHIVTRLVCALLVVVMLVALAIRVVMALRTGRLPAPDELAGAAAGVGGAYLFGTYALKRQPNAEVGPLPEPSEEVRALAMRPGSKVEAMRAYRQQTGLGVKEALEAVERMTSDDGLGA